MDYNHIKDYRVNPYWQPSRIEAGNGAKHLLNNLILKAMFKLELYDRIGNKLNMGDIVKISNGKEFTFYAEVKYLEAEKCITPFHTFSFHSFEKVEKVPDHAIKSAEERYGIWYTHNPEVDESAKEAEKYLIDWRQCEHLLQQRCFRIELI